MDKLKQEAIDGYDKKIAEMKKAQEGLNLLPDGMGELEVVLYEFTDHPRIDLPFSISLFAKLRRLLGPAWKREGYEHTDTTSGHQYLSYRHKETGTYLTVCLKSNIRGATCVRRLIGSKEVPVYEVVCH